MILHLQDKEMQRNNLEDTSATERTTEVVL